MEQFIPLAIVFFFWGFVTASNDILIPVFKKTNKNRFTVIDTGAESIILELPLPLLMVSFAIFDSSASRNTELTSTYS